MEISRRKCIHTYCKHTRKCMRYGPNNKNKISFPLVWKVITRVIVVFACLVCIIMESKSQTGFLLQNLSEGLPRSVLACPAHKLQWKEQNDRMRCFSSSLRAWNCWLLITCQGASPLKLKLLLDGQTGLSQYSLDTKQKKEMLYLGNRRSPNFKVMTVNTGRP